MTNNALNNDKNRVASSWRRRRQRLVFLLALLASAVAYGALAYAVPRADFGALLGWFGLATAAYAVLLWARLPLRWGLGAALALRLLWLPAVPAWSDDFYRFRWDGLLTTNDLNPYQFRPEELVARTAPVPLAPALAQELAQLYPRLNSPRYYSVYPPVSQAVFWLATRLSPHSERGFVLLLRLVLLAAEALTAWLLLRLLAAAGQPPRRALAYLLHPLVVVELTGNLHFEALALAGGLLAVWLLWQRRSGLAGGALALAVATKLLPVVVLPLLLRRLGTQRWLLVAAATLGGLVLLFAPFATRALAANIGRSLTLYFQNFEFNASLYYLLRGMGYRLTGYNEIHRLGPLLAGVAALVGASVLLGERQPKLANLPQALLLLLTVYYLTATVVHPWYLTPLVALSCFGRWQFPLVWGALAVLSYSAYQTANYSENLGLVAVEYGLTLGYLLWEWRKGRLRIEG